jgi:hypothetical protein
MAMERDPWCHKNGVGVVIFGLCRFRRLELPDACGQYVQMGHLHTLDVHAHAKASFFICASRFGFRQRCALVWSGCDYAFECPSTLNYMLHYGSVVEDKLVRYDGLSRGFKLHRWKTF